MSLPRNNQKSNVNTVFFNSGGGLITFKGTGFGHFQGGEGFDHS